METWKVNGSDQSTAIWVEDASGKRVASVKNCDNDLDRARLIAAAPELLEALEEILFWASSMHDQSEENDYNPAAQNIGKSIRKAVKVIKKAKDGR